MNVTPIVSSTNTPSLWQLALDQSVSGVIVYEAVRDAKKNIKTFRVRLANRQAEHFVGYSREEMLERTVAELFPVTNTTTLWDNVAQVIETGHPYRAELFYPIERTRREHWFDVSIEPLGNSDCAVVSFTDITTLKIAQENLLSESILFKTLSSSVPGLSVVVASFFQKVLIANGELPGLFASQDADQVVGHRMVDCILPEFRPEWQQYLSAALTGESFSFSDQWGGWRCECYVGPVRNERGDVVMAICAFRDISEQYRQQQELQRINADLERSNASLEQFAYVASHDLQEPLRKIKSFGDLLADRYANSLDQTGLDMLSRMQSAADRMSDLIRNLLNYARLTTPAPLNDTPVNLNELLQTILTDLDLAIRDKNASIRIQGDLPTISGELTQLRQLFQNLLTNAIKFVSPDRSPVVELTSELIRGSAVPAFAGLDRDGSYTQISIRDNGIGIAPENFNKIFGLFNRLHGRKQFAGTGIGLATCLRVAENHGGTITVASEVDHGSTFTVYLKL